MKPDALDYLAPSAPEFGENLISASAASASFVPVVRASPGFVELRHDVWGTSPDEERPFPVPAPSSFDPASRISHPASRNPDLSQHHYDMLDAEIKQLEARIAELKIAATRSA